MKETRGESKPRDARLEAIADQKAVKQAHLRERAAAESKRRRIERVAKYMDYLSVWACPGRSGLPLWKRRTVDEQECELRTIDARRDDSWIEHNDEISLALLSAWAKGVSRLKKIGLVEVLHELDASDPSYSLVLQMLFALAESGERTAAIREQVPQLAELRAVLGGDRHNLQLMFKDLASLLRGEVRGPEEAQPPQDPEWDALDSDSRCVLTALLEEGAVPKGERIGGEQLAKKALGLQSRSGVEPILKTLDQKGYVEPKRGRHGGWQLTERGTALVERNC